MELDTRYIESSDPRIQGWYAGEPSSLDCELVWSDRGNGPEIVNDGVWGPYDSEEAAMAACG